MPTTTYEEWIQNRLTVPPLTNAGARVYPLKLPEGDVLAAGAAVVWQKIDGPNDHTQSSGPVRHPRFQLSCWAKTLWAAIQLADEVRARVAVRATVGDLTVVGLIEDDGRDDEDQATHEVRRMLDVILW
jgi:hypothetical protein